MHGEDDTVALSADNDHTQYRSRYCYLQHVVFMHPQFLYYSLYEGGAFANVCVTLRACVVIHVIGDDYGKWAVASCPWS